MPSLLFKFIFTLLVCFPFSTTATILCPYSRDEIDALDFSGLKKCKFDTANAKRCEACGCQFFEAFLPLLGGKIDCDEGGEGVLQTVIACKAFLLPKLAVSMDVRLFGLAGELAGPKQCVDEGLLPPKCFIEAVEAACPETSAAVRAIRGDVDLDLHFD